MNVQSTHQSTLQDFQVIHELGSGSFSNVYRVKRIADGQEYALKKVKIANLKPKEKQNALNEVRFLYSINHKHIVAYKEAFIDEPSQCLCIVMELLSGGDVYKKISQARGSTPFTEMDIWRALIHITLGLKALHDQKVVHRDLKSANVFLSSDGTFKLGDLNVSKVAKAGFVYTQTGTPYYASPEVWRDQPYDMKSDIWSLGCVIYEMCSLQTPFRAKDMDLLFQKVQRGTYDQIQSHFSKDLSQIISSLLQIQPNNRPTCDQILANPIVQKHMKNLETNIETKPINKTLMETIQFPNNFKQLKNKLPKSNYDEVNPNVSADKVQDNKSTDKSTSPFRYPQQQYLPITESGISQSQNQSQVNVIQAQQPSPQQIKNNSILDKNLIGVQQPQPQIRQQPYNNKTEKPQSAQLNSRQNPYERAHELKEQKEREIRQQREKDQLLREKRERDAREAKLAKEAKEKQIQEAKEKQLQEAKLRESREQQRLLMEKQQREQQEQQQFRRVSPISAQPRDYQYANYINQQQPRSQHSYSPITRQVEQQNIQQGYNGQRVSYGNQVQQRPINSQSINVSQNHPNQYSRPYNQEISQHRISQTPQSAAPRQQYSPFQKPVTERYPAHPQSALPSSNIRESQKSERPQVFPTSAKVVKQRQSDTNLKKEFSSPTQQQAIRPAGKLTRQQSNNIFQQVDRIKSDPKPQNNFITGNYNHFYPIDNYKRHVSDQNLIKYQLRSQDKQALLRPQINNRKY
ncbi:unnamed protein product [Paramecium octaurelia]|uniref:non-specific serine/threonine protein kinase n=1 Tax=Paramecium octaurelia TaxID=43137 RepID=A0A8S1T1F6_PAROT|nr:unnamed protein product [Paramecium octaurelia]